MIEIILENDTNKRRLLVQGHAGFAKNGEDIVCAGVSALVGAYGMYVSKLCDVKGLEEIERLWLDEGQADICSSVRCSEAMAAWDLVADGLQAIQMEYPKNVRVVFRDEITM